MKNKGFSRVRCIVIAVLLILLAAVSSVAALFVCAFASLDRQNAAVISLCIFALVSAAAFLYLILTPPKNEKIIKFIGFAGLAFDIILVPVYAVMRLITGG